MATITCKHCGTIIPVETISDGELAICEHCAAINNLSDEPLPFPQKNKAKQGIPDKITYRQLPDATEIHYQWFSRFYWVALFGSLFSCLPLFLYIGYFVREIINSPSIATVFSLFISQVTLFLLVTLIAALGTYRTLQGFFNETIITINQQGITTHTRPIHYFKNTEIMISREDIYQVYCKQKSDGVRYEESYIVYYATKGKINNVLVQGVPTIEEALFIEQQIERLYGIKDAVIPGEWGYQQSRLEQSDISQNTLALQQKRKQSK